MHSLIRRVIPLPNFSKPSVFLRKYANAYLVELARRTVTSTFEPRDPVSSIVLVGAAEATPRMREKPYADLYLCREANKHRCRIRSIRTKFDKIGFFVLVITA
jgi:hypothetical protein